ncbi:MAG: GWxTD domain-containing protein [Bacteroidota bacterium]
MKNLYIPLIFLILNACSVSNTSLNDNNKSKNSKLVTVTRPLNLLRTKFLENGDNLRVFGSLLTSDSLDAYNFRSKYISSYAFVFDYAAKDKADFRNIPINENSIVFKNKTVNFYFDIPKPKTEIGSFFLKIELVERSTSVKTQSELAIRLNSKRTSDSFGLFNINDGGILLNNYVNFQDSIVIKSLNEIQHKFTVVRYKHDFDAALSPLAVGQKPSPKPLYVDSLYEVDSNKPFVLGQEGLYYFIKDTTDRTGMSLLGVDNRYPRYTKPSQLTKPLVYLTTNQEFQSINSDADTKKRLDQFWLTLYNNNQISAKKTIKSLYRKIETANTFFSNYKEGWKTDKGMVYIIMGLPDNIRFLRDKEVWVYTKNSKFSEINFTFTKRPNQFIEDHYELSRFSEFQPIWFPAVEAIRSGDNL